MHFLNSSQGCSEITEMTHERKIHAGLHISSGRIVQNLLLYQFHNGEDDLGLRIEIIAIINCVSTVITSIG
jgi:hypothetical protein